MVKVQTTWRRNCNDRRGIGDTQKSTYLNCTDDFRKESNLVLETHGVPLKFSHSSQRRAGVGYPAFFQGEEDDAAAELAILEG